MPSPSSPQAPAGSSEYLYGYVGLYSGRRGCRLVQSNPANGPMVWCFSVGSWLAHLPACCLVVFAVMDLQTGRRQSAWLPVQRRSWSSCSTSTWVAWTAGMACWMRCGSRLLSTQPDFVYASGIQQLYSAADQTPLGPGRAKIWPLNVCAQPADCTCTSHTAHMPLAYRSGRSCSSPASSASTWVWM